MAALRKLGVPRIILTDRPFAKALVDAAAVARIWRRSQQPVARRDWAP